MYIVVYNLGRPIYLNFYCMKLCENTENVSYLLLILRTCVTV